MTNEEKILEMLTQMQEQMTQMQGQQTQMQGTLTQVQADLIQVQADQKEMDQRLDRFHRTLFNTQTDLINLKTYTFELKDEQAALNSCLGKVQDELHGVKAYLELDVEKRFDGVNLGINDILEQLKPQKHMGERVDKLEDDVIVLKTAVKLHSEDISELKKAQ